MHVSSSSYDLTYSQAADYAVHVSSSSYDLLSGMYPPPHMTYSQAADYAVQLLLALGRIQVCVADVFLTCC